MLYEALVYHVSEERVLVECDKRAVYDLMSHLKRYSLRRRVSWCVVLWGEWGVSVGQYSVADWSNSDGSSSTEPTSSTSTMLPYST